jgi:hypothetical protein
VGSREVNIAHFGVLFPAARQAVAEVGLALITLAAVMVVAWRRKNDPRSAAAVVVGGGVLAALHALPTDMVLVALALAIWGKAQWYDWLLLSVGTAIAAFTPVPIPTVAGVLTIGWVLLRAGGVIPWRRQAPAPMSTG